MSIEKDLGPIYQSMIQTSYVPIMRKTIIKLLMQDIGRMQEGLKIDDHNFLNVLHSQSGKVALLKCLDLICERRSSIIQEILYQFGIDTSPEMASFYHEHFDTHFCKQINLIKRIVYDGLYHKLERYLGES